MNHYLITCTLYKPRLLTLTSLIITVFIFTNLSRTHAQREMIGTTTRTGGEIFKIDENGESYETLVDFTPSANFSSGLVEANGKFYGTSSKGGGVDAGTLYSINLDGSDYQRLVNFGGLNGTIPKQALIKSNDRLWGTANGGGSSQAGVIFSIATDGSDFRVEHNFSGTNGKYPEAKLVDVDGVLWGTTRKGGNSDHGVIYSIGNDGTNFTVRHHFDGIDGSEPSTSLTLYDDKLVGVTSKGGRNGVGAFFIINKDGTEFKERYSFSSNFANRPSSSLVVIDGKLWGTTYEGGGSYNQGAVYTLELTSPSSISFRFQHRFNDGTGKNPSGGLLFTNNRLYGTTVSGGGSDDGIIFSIDPYSASFWKDFRVEHEFDIAFGGRPVSELIFKDGRLWGTTSVGGEYHDSSILRTSLYGVIYSLAPDGTDFQVEYQPNFKKGRSPRGTVIKSNDRLWGTTLYGGDFDRGVIFSMMEDGSDYKVEHNFEGSSGANPFGNLVENEGRLWGTTFNGGSTDQGVIFSIAFDGTDYKVEHEFVSATGAKPKGDLLVQNGRFYGTTSIGGSNNVGVLFSISSDGTDYVVEQSFSMANGAEPLAGLIKSNGRLWGTASEGGSRGEGVVFSTALDGSDFIVEHAFSGVSDDGANPSGDLTEIGDKIWGTTQFGGAENSGVIFSMNIDGSNFQVEHSFSSTTGAQPQAKILELNGKIFGTTKIGGERELGVFYSFNLASKEYKVLKNFRSHNTGSVQGALYIKADKSAPIISSSSDAAVDENITGTVYEAVADEPVTWSFGNEKDESLFTLNSTSIKFKSPPDFENPSDLNKDNVYEIKLIATDEAGNSSSEMLKINVEDVDDSAPIIISKDSIYVSENFNGAVFIAEANELSEFSLKGNRDEALFTISNDSVKFKSAPDFENPSDLDKDNVYEVKLLATDRAGNSSSKMVNIIVEDVDDTAPIITSEDSIQVTENFNGLVFIAEANELSKFYLEGDRDGDLFTISNDSVKFKSAPDFEAPLDADTNNIYEINLIAEDQAGNSSALIVKIEVSNIDDDSPNFTSASEIQISEDTSGVIYIIQTDEGVTYEIDNTKDGSLFLLSIDSLSFKSSPDFENPQDEDSNNIYEIDLIATDTVGNSSVLNLEITVKDVEDEGALSNRNEIVKFVLYPNPVKTAFKLRNVEALKGQNLLIYNSKGKLVRQFKVSALNEYNVKGLEAGLYFLYVKDDDQIYHLEKLLID